MIPERHILPFAIALMLSSSFLSGQNLVSDTLSIANEKDAVIKELPLPFIPKTIARPEERAAYILSHFWDGMDFGDTLLCRDREFMEQNLVNFISLFPHARQEALPAPVAKFLGLAATDTAGLRLVSDIVETYLDDPNSPMRDEGYYIIFLEELLRLPDLPEHDRSRDAYLLEMALKNRPGTTATDFSYTDRDGNRQTLHATSGKRLLLLFYDPACSHCADILDGLRESAVINRLLEEDELTLLAVYTEGDRAVWDKTKNDLPPTWTVGIDNSGIVEHELYGLPAMPVIYLLDERKKVILKDPVPAVVGTYLDGNSK